MDKLYPQNYKEPPKADPVVKDPAKLKAFIKAMVTIPLEVAAIVKMVDQHYVETGDEDYHYLAEDIHAVCVEIDKEWHPAEVEEVKP